MAAAPLSGIAQPAPPTAPPAETPVVPPGQRAGPRAWAWALMLAAQVACAAVATSYTFFFLDDLLFLNQARAQSLSLGYLREQLFEHFSPVSRLLDTLLVSVAPGSFAFAHAIELTIYLAALLAFAFVASTILGNGWRAFALTVVFGQSVFLFRLLNWWTATANILPSTVLMLVALGCYLRWRERRSRAMLAASFLAYAVALLDYELAILLPLYAALIRLVVIERRPGPRAWLRALWDERAAWIGYGVIAALAIANYYAFYYSTDFAPTHGNVSLHALGAFGVNALVNTFVPALAGIKYAVAPDSHPAVAAATAAALVAAAGVTAWLRPRAWRCVGVFALVFLVTMLPVGLARVGHYGATDGNVLYYQQSIQFMFLVLAAFALSERWSGERPVRPIGPAARRMATVAGGAAIIAYAALLVVSVRAMSAASWQPRQDQAYVSRFLAGVRRVEARTGRPPALVDLTVPKQRMPKPLWPFNSYDVFFGLFDRTLRVDRIAPTVYTVAFGGALVARHFETLASGRMRRATTAASAVAPARSPADDGCPAPHAGGSVRVPLTRTVNTTGIYAAARIRFRGAVTAPVLMFGIMATPGRSIQLGPTSRLVPAPKGELIPLRIEGRLRGLAFQPPRGVCVESVAVGRL
ncbi:MAG: hypothetical protein ACRDLP_05500 [Solirubrobacteraceae bacterium]